MNRTREGWQTMWERLLSPATARFILALLALLAAAGGTFYLMAFGLDVDAEQAVIFALGQLVGLSLLAVGYYFGSTARGDERPNETKIVNTADDPAQVENVEEPHHSGPRPGDTP